MQFLVRKTSTFLCKNNTFNNYSRSLLTLSRHQVACTRAFSSTCCTYSDSLANAKAKEDKDNDDENDDNDATTTYDFGNSQLQREFQSLLAAAHKGDPEAQYNLGNSYLIGYGVRKSETEAFKWFKLAAEKGNIAEAQLNIGLMMTRASNDGSEKQQQTTTITAAEWFEKAAKQGNAQAQFNIALSYERGHNGIAEPDMTKAVYYYELAAEQGLVDAQYALALSHLSSAASSNTPAECYAKAAQWLHKASEQEHPRAQFFLGKMYLQNNVVTTVTATTSNKQPSNEKLALTLFERASQHGHAQAQYFAGLMLSTGKERVVAEGSVENAEEDTAIVVYKDMPKAIEYLTKAAEQGLVNAQCVLAECLEEIDEKEKALVYYDMAAAKGNQKAKLKALKIRAFSL